MILTVQSSTVVVRRYTGRPSWLLEVRDTSVQERKKRRKSSSVHFLGIATKHNSYASKKETSPLFLSSSRINYTIVHIKTKYHTIHLRGEGGGGGVTNYNSSEKGGKPKYIKNKYEPDPRTHNFLKQLTVCTPHKKKFF